MTARLAYVSGSLLLLVLGCLTGGLDVEYHVVTVSIRTEVLHGLGGVW